MKCRQWVGVTCDTLSKAQTPEVGEEDAIQSAEVKPEQRRGNTPYRARSVAVRSKVLEPLATL
jgi:hypothetical protein